MNPEQCEEPGCTQSIYISYALTYQTDTWYDPDSTTMVLTCYIHVMGMQWLFIATATIEISWISPNLYQRISEIVAYCNLLAPCHKKMIIFLKYKPIQDSSKSKILTARRQKRPGYPSAVQLMSNPSPLSFITRHKSLSNLSTQEQS